MTRREVRALRVGTMVVALGVALRLLPAAIGTERRARTRVAEQSATVARMRADLAGLGALEEIAQQVQASVARLAPRLISGNTAAEGAAALTAAVRSHAERGGMKVDRIVTAPDTTRVGGLMRVGVLVVGESDAQGLQTVMGELASDQLTLEVTALRVTATNPAAAEGLPERLAIELTVRGWWLAPGGTSPRTSTEHGAGADS